MASTTILTIVLLAVIQTAMCNNCSSPCYPSEFFPNIQGNLTKIIWAHAVNSMTELDKALASEDVMILEGDVVIGRHTLSNTTDIPIMAHPPATESDLSLDEFLKININNGSKGIKLDFKSNVALNNSKPILRKHQSTLKCPVFLNADILRGPINASAPLINATDFLKEAGEIIPDSVLSIGWTTRYGKEYNITDGRYTVKQLRMMVDVVTENPVNQPITYPVRAGLAVNDIDGMKALLKNTTSTGGVTLTIWSSEGDAVNATKLSKLITEVGIDKVYVDVPKDLRNQLNLSSASTITSAVLNLTASTVTSAAINLTASLALLVMSRML